MSAAASNGAVASTTPHQLQLTGIIISSCQLSLSTQLTVNKARIKQFVFESLND